MLRLAVDLRTMRRHGRSSGKGTPVRQATMSDLVARICSVLALASVTALAGGPASPASAAPLLPSPAPLPGSSFQGADGDHDDAAGLVDWQGMRAAGRVQHSPDPDDDDSAFADGSKENEPRGWALTTVAGGVKPAKSNILDVWSVVDQPGSETFLYVGSSRADAGGTAFLAVELNHDARLWDNGTAEIPCRRPGDVQIAHESHGNEVEVVVRRWITTSTDLASGCARTGRFGGAANLVANVDVQGAANSTAIVNRLPGAHADTLPSQRFGEVSLNLAGVLEAAFGDECLAFGSLWMHSRASDSVSSNMQDYVKPRALALRTCAASGTKFFDSDANGRRDVGEPGIPRFLIWADYDDDGVRDDREPFSVSDDDGAYVIHDIQPPDGTYMLREAPMTNRRRMRALPAEWICSFPNDSTAGGTAAAPGGFGCGWGPIDVTMTPYAQGRDFGNWFPARLTVEKEVEPPSDPGRFDLLVNGVAVLTNAGDGASATVNLPPGTHQISERPAGATNPADFRSSVECRRTTSGRGGRRSGMVDDGLTLAAGDEASCTIRNIRPGVPAIAIRKTGPAVATAAERLRYRFFVTNPGEVAFPADAVDVADRACDDTPRLVRKRDGDGPDGSPGTLDPGDTWIYRCSRATADAGPDCEPRRVRNTGVATGAVNGTRVQDADRIFTTLLCPDEPILPSPPDPPGPAEPRDPDEPGPVAPSGPRPPEAGAAGTAGVTRLLRRATRRCIGPRIPGVHLAGTRIARVRVYSDGEFLRLVTPRILQRRVRPRVTLPPGRHRLTLRVSFERGSGSPPVWLTRTITICGEPALPRFTG
jgi:hypothetical protein